MGSINNKDLLRGGTLIAIALWFGLQALRYPIGQLALAGPGLFPITISVALLIIGIATVVRSCLSSPIRLSFSFKNVGIIVISLLIFTVISQYINMAIGIIVMVFCASLAGATYSVARNVKVSVGLIIVAFLFQKLFGLELKLY